MNEYPAVKNYIAGNFTNGSPKTMEVFSPLTGNVISSVPLSSARQLDEAVKAAQKAFPAWSSIPIKERVQVFYRYKMLLEKNMDEMSKLVHEENGKTLD